MAEIDRPVQVAVVGVGYMGEKHALAYRKLAGADLVAVVDVDPDRASRVAAKCVCAPFNHVGELLARYPNLDAVSISAPTRVHSELACYFLEQKISCFIEKPIASSELEALAIVRASKLSGSLVQVGHIERFNPVVREVRNLCLRPQLIKADRVGLVKFRALDIDVILDVMIHDLDLVLMFTKGSVSEVDVEARGFRLDCGPVQVATARLEFKSGCVAELTASRIALSEKREFRLFTDDSYISFDLLKRTATVIRERAFVEGLGKARSQHRSGHEVPASDFRQWIQAEEFDLGDNSTSTDDALTAELRYFVAAVTNGQPIEVGADVGLDALRLAEKVRKAMKVREPIRLAVG